MVKFFNGTAGVDSLFGTDDVDYMFGGAGNDVLHGGAGNDVLFGEDGNDMLVGGTGDDLMFGGMGRDHYVVDSAGDVVIEEANAGDFDQVEVVGSLSSYTLGANFEQLSHLGANDFTGKGNELNNDIWSGAGNDSLFGMDGHDELFGGGGNDSLLGEDGQDMLFGGNGDDYLEGGAGNDLLSGGIGNDELWGGEGNDRLLGSYGQDKMWGGDGSDVFVFAASGVSTLGQPDAIMDFVRGTDVIDLTGMDANELLSGEQAFTFAAGPRSFDPTLNMKTGTLVLVDRADGTHVYGQVNAGGPPDFHVLVQGTHGMGIADFNL